MKTTVNNETRRFEAPEQSDSVIKRADKQVWILVPINIPTSRQRVPKGLESRRHFVAPDYLQRQRVKFKGQEETLSVHSSTFALRPGSVL